jgi:hypothetical protein
MNPHKCHHYDEELNPQHYLMGKMKYMRYHPIHTIVPQMHKSHYPYRTTPNRHLWLHSHASPHPHCHSAPQQCAPSLYPYIYDLASKALCNYINSPYI